jgi:hypothetical protein
MPTTVAAVSQNWETIPITVTTLSIYRFVNSARLPVPITGSSGYREPVPRTDENGRQLKALLEYLLYGDIDAKDMYDALRISSSTYYRRIKDGDYPNAEELRLVSARFGLSYPDLQVRFGLMSRQEVWNYVEAEPFTVTTIDRPSTARISPKLAELRPRSDAPPL